MATHSSVLAWRIPGIAEPGGLPSMGSHRVGHDWSDLAAAVVMALGHYAILCATCCLSICKQPSLPPWNTLICMYPLFLLGPWVIENEWKNSYQERRARLRGRADHVGTWGEWDWAEEAQSALSTELWLQEGMASWISEKTGFQPWKMFCKLLLYSRLREYQGCPSLWQFNFIMSIGYKDVLKIRVHIFFCFLMSTILK